MNRFWINKIELHRDRKSLVHVESHSAALMLQSLRATSGGRCWHKHLAHLMHHDSANAADMLSILETSGMAR